MDAIGIFDSGIGGLTVLRALRRAMPDESFCYLGDTARLPYGTKSPETIYRYLKQNVSFLQALGVKALVVACNSASSVLDRHDWEGIPIYGVIEPGAAAATADGEVKRVLVLGTAATVRSGAYPAALKKQNPDLVVRQQACPLLVPLVEEGWQDDPITEQILRRYLEAPLTENPDAVILGCTHYPVLKQVVARICGPDVRLIDSAEVMAELLVGALAEGRIPKAVNPATTKIWTTDSSEDFRRVGARILEPFDVNTWLPADIR